MANQNNKFSNKQHDLFIKYLFRSILLPIFTAVEASPVDIYIIVVLQISFLRFRTDIRRCCEIYSLEVNGKINWKNSMEKLEKPNYRGRREGRGCLDESLCWMEFFPKCNNRRGAGEVVLCFPWGLIFREEA